MNLASTATLPSAFCLYLFAASGVLLSTISFACRRFLSSPAGIRGRCWIWAGSLAVSFITVSITILRFARLCLVCCCRVFRKVLPFSHTQFHSGRLWLCSGRFFIGIIRLSSRCILSPVASCDRLDQGWSARLKHSPSPVIYQVCELVKMISCYIA